MTLMERTVQTNLLRHAAGTQMFCPICTTCLDWPTTVIVELRRKGVPTDAPPSTCMTLCKDCFAVKEAALKQVCQDASLTMEITRKDPALLAEIFRPQEEA